MPALMPRCTDCVLCGEPIRGKGRIDRIYCSASCRTLAWRARAGHRFEGSRKPKLPPQPGDFIARKVLPLLAVRMRAELAAAKQCIAELQERLADQGGGSAHDARKVAVGVFAAVGAIGIAAALRRRRRRQRAKPERARDEVEVERQRHQAEMTAAGQRAANREAELLEQVTALTVRAEQAEAREQAAVASLSPLKQAVEALRHELNQNENNAKKMNFDMAALQGALSEANKQRCRQSEALLKDSQQRQHLQLQLNEFRRHIKILQQELDATDAKLTEESQQREHLQLQLAAIQKQLGSERREWQNAARALLTQHEQKEHIQLVADNHQLRHLLAGLESRTQVTEVTITEHQHEVGNQEHRSLERMEQIQRNQLADSSEEPKRLSNAQEQRQLVSGLPNSQEEPKQLSSTKAQKRLVSGLPKVGVLLMTLGAVKNAAKDTALPDRKRLPPKRE